MDNKVKVAAISVISNTSLVIMKLVVGVMMGSVSIISEAIHSGLDLIAAIMAFFSVRISSLPPDNKYRYGYGKIENVSGTLEALLILVAALWIIFEAVKKLIEGAEVQQIGVGLLVMGISAVINFGVSGLLLKTAQKTDSIALEADALHLRTDVYTSLGVFVGLGLIYFTGLSILDPLIAIGVATLIIKASWKLTHRAFAPLVDVALSDQEEKVIIEVLGEYQDSGRISGYHDLRTRKSGKDRLVDLHVEFPGGRDLFTVHGLSDQIEQDIKDKLPHTSVLIHMEPCCDEKGCHHCDNSNENLIKKNEKE